MPIWATKNTTTAPSILKWLMPRSWKYALADLGRFSEANHHAIDGGTTWSEETQADAGGPIGSFNSIRFASNTEGYIVGHMPGSGPYPFGIYRTVDGGKTWTKARSCPFDVTLNSVAPKNGEAWAGWNDGVILHYPEQCRY